MKHKALYLYNQILRGQLKLKSTKPKGKSNLLNRLI
jgi:hypothetical protein